MMPKLCFVQPILTSYRDPIFNELNELLGNSLVVCAANPPKEFGEIEPPSYQLQDPQWKKLGLLHYMPFKAYTTMFRSSDRFIHFCDFKYLSLWLLILNCLVTGKQIWLHGQGGYKRKGLLHRSVYTLSIWLSDGYICYTEFSARCLKKVIPKRLHSKIKVVSNTLSLEPSNGIQPANSNHLLYMGRLRQGCGIELLLEAAKNLSMGIKVVGAGNTEFIDTLKAQYPDAQFYGPIFDYQKQKDIANECLAGVYGGDAGLSVVHYMALGLPVIVHGDLMKHMGPEPSYVEDGKNGLVFERENLHSLQSKIQTMKDNPAMRDALAENALDTFRNLIKPSMAQKFAQIVEA